MPFELHWLRPAWLWLLPLLLLLLVILVLRLRRSRRWEELVDAPLRPLVLTGKLGGSPWPPLAGLALGWVLLVLALAGPAWQLASRPVFRIEQPRVLLLDLSDSMQAVDVVPSRLARARFEVMDLLRTADEGQFALIAFGAEPFLIAPLTTDAGTVLEQVPLLEPALLPVSGERRTDLALEAAARLLRRSTAAGADVILVADAVAPADRTRQAAAALAAAGHRVSVLAVVPHAGFDGVAAAGAGVVTAARADDLDSAGLLALQGPPTAEAAGQPLSLERQWRDDGPWVLLLTLPLLALAFRRGWLGLLPLALLVMLPPAPVQAGFWGDLWLRPAQRVLRDADAGRLDAALAGVDDPRWQAALRYRAGDFEGALAALAGLGGAEAHYNRGNVLARLGRFDDAVAELDAALALVPTHADARHNRRLLLDLMRRPQAAPTQTAPTRTARGDEADGAGDEAGAAAGEPSSQPDARPGADSDDVADRRQGGVALPDTAAPAGAATVSAPVGGAAERSGHPRTAATTAAARPPAGRPSPLPGDEGAVVGESNGSPGGVGDDSSVGTELGPMADGAREPLGADDVVADTYLLQQVPDDPGRLLRERLLLQYLRRHGQLH